MDLLVSNSIKMKKIDVVSSHLNAGGVAAVTFEYISLMESIGFDVNLFLTDNMPVSCRWQSAEDFICLTYNFKSSKYWNLPIHRVLVKNLVEAFRFFITFKANGNTKVFVHFFPIFLGMIFKIIHPDEKVIFWFHTDLVSYYHSQRGLKRLFLYLFLRSTNVADQKVFLTNDIRNGFVKLTCNETGNSVIPNVFSGRAVKAPEISTYPQFIVVGRLTPTKNIDIVVKSFFAYLVKGGRGRLVIAGDGPDFNRLQELISESVFSERVSLLGSVDDMKSLYSNSDVFISFSQLEGFPVAHLEAIQFGLRVLTVNACDAICDVMAVDSTLLGQSPYGCVIDKNIVKASNFELLSDNLFKILEVPSAEIIIRQKLLDRFSVGIISKDWESLI